MKIQNRKNGVYGLYSPKKTGPVVVDSPHSGRIYPPDFHFSCDFAELRRAEDLLLDEMLSSLPDFGIPLLLAEFPRTYIDVNRSVTDIDQALLNRPWPGVIDPTGRSFAGIGLIRRILKRPDTMVYDKPLEVAAIRQRIEEFYKPYHERLEQMITDSHAIHGVVVHLNVHSMSYNAFSEEARIPIDQRYDIVLGDRNGSTCAPVITHLIGKLFEKKGYTIGYNTPFAGAEIVRRHGRPRDQRHSLQIEINKALYVDEKRLRLTAGANLLRQDIHETFKTLAEIVSAQAQDIAAE